MKELLVESPQQQRNRDALPLPDAEDDSGTNDGCSDGDEPADVDMGVDHDESSGCGDEEDSSDDENGSSEHGVQPMGRITQQAVRVDGGVSEEKNDVSDDDSLVAPTLRLSEGGDGGNGDHASGSDEGEPGDESGDGESDEPNGDDHGQEDTQAMSDEAKSDDDGIDWRDSQVSSSWLGRFYSKYGRFGKEESDDPNLPKCVEEGDQDSMLKHIRDSLNGCSDDGE